jgi:prepilin-type N-terminal cleavage/methylation domain-containing protein
MLSTLQKTRHPQGFTLIEMGVVIAIVAIMASVGLMAFKNQGETQDAALANSVQASLQIAVGQMVTRLERTPQQVFNTTQFRQRLMQFAQGSMGNTAKLTDTGSGVRLTFGGSSRSVTYGMNNQGDIIVTNDTFAKFNADGTGLLKEIP